MMQKITPLSRSIDSKQNQVKIMFDNVSKDYDFINKVITLGLDKTWRIKIIKYLKNKNCKNIVDLATGTGDMLPLLASIEGVQKVYGLDISPKMLEVAKKKIQKKEISEKITLTIVDSEKIPVNDNSIDAVTIVYGIRNFEDYQSNLKEIHRILSEKGHLIILETSVPTSTIFNFFYKLYVRKIMPLIGRFFSSNNYAYKYLGTSAENFPFGKQFSNSVCEIGFEELKIQKLFFGVSSIYYFKKN